MRVYCNGGDLRRRLVDTLVSLRDGETTVPWGAQLLLVMAGKESGKFKVLGYEGPRYGNEAFIEWMGQAKL